jgi:hypothetical protein
VTVAAGGAGVPVGMGVTVGSDEQPAATRMNADTNGTIPTRIRRFTEKRRQFLVIVAIKDKRCPPC